MKHLLISAALLALFAPVSIAQAEEDLWRIETNLSPSHPCAEAGGTWRGWCMTRGNRGEMLRPYFLVTSGRATEHLSQNQRLLTRSDIPCIDILSYPERRACYRAQRMSLFATNYDVRPEARSTIGGVTRRSLLWFQKHARRRIQRFAMMNW